MKEQSAMNKSYYFRLRNKYLPQNLLTVFIFESPPASGKYFYNEDGKISEPMFMELMKLLKFKPKNKKGGLSHFAKMGYFLVDATYEHMSLSINLMVRHEKMLFSKIMIS